MSCAPLVAALALIGGGVATAMPQSAAPTAADAATPAGRLAALYDDIWQRWLREDPTLATSVGDRRYDDRWPDLSPAAVARAAQEDRESLAALETIGPGGLSAADRTTYEVVKLQLERRLSLAPFEPAVYAVSHLGSLQSATSPQSASELQEVAPFANVADYEHWIARLRGFGRLVDQVTEELALGVREGRTQPRVLMERVLPQLEAQRVARPEDSPFYAPFKRMPASIGAADRERLGAEGRAAIAGTVLPAMARFTRYFTGTYLPACRDSIGISATPGGAAYYRALIAYHTTTDKSAAQIHAIGLAEVARIHRAMDEVIARVGFKGDFAQFAHMLRTDPRFFYTNGEDLLHGYMVIAKSIDPNLVQLFGRLPRTPYGVRPVPDTSAPNTTTAYYQPLAQDGSRAGYYMVNLYRPEARPRWEMEVLTAHEAVPGHHLQIALQYENATPMPMIRRSADFTAYVEGWALYAEGLGERLGLYTDPYQKFGELTYDMWRAVRLVVDTGIHAQGWTRQQAIDYFMQNAPKSALDVANEVDRYIAWPGQALAYKMGQLEILALRERARAALGDAFDIREFHDVVLGTGAVPLPLLDRTVAEWIEAKRAAIRPNASPPSRP